jgi:hypothetical protein
MIPDIQGQAGHGQADSVEFRTAVAGPVLTCFVELAPGWTKPKKMTLGLPMMNVHPKCSPQTLKPLSRRYARRLTALSIFSSRADSPGGISRFGQETRKR